jgi:hypothetical protein
MAHCSEDYQSIIYSNVCLCLLRDLGSSALASCIVHSVEATTGTTALSSDYV